MDTCSSSFPSTLRLIQDSTGLCTMKIKCFLDLMTMTSPQAWRHPCICCDRRFLLHLSDISVVTVLIMLSAVSS